MHGIYKYVVDDQVVYVGKTDSDFATRIACHRRESAFAPYRDKAKIYVCLTKDAREADFLETVLINQYKPKLNVKKKGVTAMKVSAEVEWTYWENVIDKKLKSNPKVKKNSYAFYLSESNMETLKKIAKQKKVSTSEYLDQLLSDVFSSYPA